MDTGDQSSGVPPGQRRYGIVLVAGVVGALGLILVALWRERPSFWVEISGYPNGLRRVVRHGFWPLWVAVATTGVGGVVQGLRRLRDGRLPDGVLGVVISTMVAGTAVAALMIVVWNNLNAWLRGLPLHSH